MATALVAVVCVEGGTSSSTPKPLRDDLLRQAFAVRGDNPLRAADLLHRAGAGVVLERVRMEAWIECLERGGGDSPAWQLFLATTPPPDLERRAQLGQGRALLAEGEVAAAVAILERAAVAGSLAAEEILVDCADEHARRRAADRLAVTSPGALARLSPSLERRSLARLDAAGWLRRAAAWRDQGSPTRAARELGARRWQGNTERERVRELARAQIAAGSPSRALQVLPSPRQAVAGEHVLLAEVYRVRAWQRFPRSSAGVAFRSCLTAAGRAVASSGDDEATRQAARILILECATEVDELSDALEAWRALAATGWQGEQRGWLGRRLGLALARAEGRGQETIEVASAVSEHRRCLRFWSPGSGAQRRQVLQDLATVDFADVYALWAREELGVPAPDGVQLAALARPAQPPPAAATLIAWGALEEASRYWAWVRQVRGGTPAEAVAAAEFELGQGRRMTAIAGLRTMVPELGTVDMARAPKEAVRAYLPLRWQAELIRAARESRIEPWLLAAVARQESLFGRHARSPRGALGLLQLIPSTARTHGLALGLGPGPDLFDPEVNLRIGARELASLVRRFGAVEPALAAYNAGEPRARRWWRRWPDRRRFTEAVPIPETYNYVRRVRYLAEAYRLVHAPTWREAP